jgi:hypothetical protein
MRCTEPQAPASYEAVHRYDGAVIQRGRRERIEPCVVQPRDVSIVGDVRRYKFLTAPQLRQLWWPGSSVQAADRRLLKLFRADYLDRFRPICRLSWEGEAHIEPPREARTRQGVLRLGDYWSAEGLRDPRPRLVRPDAVLEVARADGDGSRVFFIEYDRTQRVDKNYAKFRRYDTFLCWWCQHTSFVEPRSALRHVHLPGRRPARSVPGCCRP